MTPRSAGTDQGVGTAVGATPAIVSAHTDRTGAYSPRLADHPDNLRQIAVDLAVELAYDRGYSDGHRAGLAAGHAVRYRVEREQVRRLEAARTGTRRTAATARDERLLDNLRAVGILPAVAA